MRIGVDYYPEHWPETMWEEDLRRMLENGIEVIRIAEFAWNKVEPTEGTFTFDFFDRFLDVAEKSYIVLLPLDESGQNEDGEVWFYGYSENEENPDEEPELRYIEDDDEYEMVADAFERVDSEYP